ncbi:hypothetical protein Y032_0008g10 [Ancylostoma ceylanicum]|uniref:Uncharacterized protein n=1 Tax=Ancylostoma ceylanicum TaxID=53326 RepID=A0A016VJ65_9BILA|nr:hypothetical protein Y032_0008g10 [Ancylostoma ceylanicum]
MFGTFGTLRPPATFGDYVGTLRPPATPTGLDSYGSKHNYIIYYGLTPFEFIDGRDGRRECASQSRLSTPLFPSR